MLVWLRRGCHADVFSFEASDRGLTTANLIGGRGWQREGDNSGSHHPKRLDRAREGNEIRHMSDDSEPNGKIENFAARQFRKLSGELEERDATTRAHIGRVHSELSEVKANVARMHADIISMRSIMLDAIVQLTSLKNRVIVLEDTPHAE